jgi:hypothetical protein
MVLPTYGLIIDMIRGKNWICPRKNGIKTVYDLRIGMLDVKFIDISYTLDSTSLLVKLKPRIFQRLPPFE